MLDADRVEVVSVHREGVGVRLAVRTRILGLPAFTEPMEVIGWEPPRRLVLRHGGLIAGEGTWILTPEPGGTRFVWTEDVRLEVPGVGEAAARLYAPVLRWLMRRAAAGLRGAVIASGPRRR
jgi:Polyketide cyclase / dehydrase and lipid transport